MVYTKTCCVTILFVIYVCSSAANQRPNYLTDEDFAKARLIQSAAINGTMFTPPNYRKDQPDITPKNAYRHRTWPNARVPYTLDPDFDENQRVQVARAIENYQSKTCVRFDPKQPEDNDFVEILRDDTTCGLAHVCRIGGPQFAKFGGGCISAAVMSHELGHTLCFGHEQTRPDRDDWISWNTDICNPHGKDNPDDFTTLDLFYDYVSLQHYEGECYNGCIIPKVPGVTKCGGGDDLSVIDIEKINAFYGCEGCYSYRFRPMNLITGSDRLLFGGVDITGETLYPCRGYHNGDIIVGKGNPRSRVCYVGYGGLEHVIQENFEIITNPERANLFWIRRPADGSFPENAVRGGRTAEREPLYIGRCSLVFDGRPTTIPGKIHRSASDGMFVVFGGREYVCYDFEILVCA
ncbi:zinc metalloproteinase nas-8-like [Bradysia coprophila]|uniref:zinc metalloproteinase nas-8-like n=1 Tax=Bradysia coprophila TaxID=38358 RepID=UPI00187DCEE8|nr:zinc metalloproteinase nas-8-like [Bradysia coprophila]